MNKIEAHIISPDSNLGYRSRSKRRSGANSSKKSEGTKRCHGEVFVSVMFVSDLDVEVTLGKDLTTK